MSKFILMFFIIFFQNTPAEDREPHKSVQVSMGYFSGEYLVYDCLKNSFICVDEEGNLDCKAAREHSIKISELKLPCAPLKKFPHYDDCATAQYQHIESPKKKEFCLLKRGKIH